MNVNELQLALMGKLTFLREDPKWGQFNEDNSMAIIDKKNDFIKDKFPGLLNGEEINYNSVKFLPGRDFVLLSSKQAMSAEDYYYLTYFEECPKIFHDPNQKEGEFPVMFDYGDAVIIVAPLDVEWEDYDWNELGGFDREKYFKENLFRPEGTKLIIYYSSIYNEKKEHQTKRKNKIKFCCENLEEIERNIEVTYLDHDFVVSIEKECYDDDYNELKIELRFCPFCGEQVTFHEQNKILRRKECKTISQEPKEVCEYHEEPLILEEKTKE